MSSKGHPRIASADLNQLMSALDINVVGLSECLVSPGFRLDLGGNASPGMHYILKGSGLVRTTERAPPIPVRPHTLIVVPPKTAFKLEAPGAATPGYAPTIVDGRTQFSVSESIRRYVAGDNDPELIMICGYFNATYAPSTDLFDSLSEPIVEQFDESDQLDVKLRNALNELVAQEIGAGAISSALLKQVVIALVRRSLASMRVWTERFSMLSDPAIAHAFSEMAANPGKAHTVEMLAQKACLSRSAFMTRFTHSVGRPPMAVLRDLRMRQASSQLTTTGFTIDQIATNAGYASRSSFVRAFKMTYDVDPTEFRNRERLEK